MIHLWPVSATREIRHTSCKVEFDADGDRIEQKGNKGMNTEIMKDWVSKFVKIAKEGDILVIDNLNSHHSVSVLDRLWSSGITLIFIPSRLAYLVSPLDNYIFAYMKNQWRTWFTVKQGIFSKEEKQLFLGQLLRRVTNSELLLSSFMGCGLSMFHPQEVQLDETLPLEKYLTKNQFSSFDTQWYKSSPLAQMVKGRRLSYNLYVYSHFIDVTISFSDCEEHNHSMSNESDVEDEIDTNVLIETSEDLDDSCLIDTSQRCTVMSIMRQLSQGRDINTPTMLVNTDLPGFITFKEKDLQELSIKMFLSTEHNYAKLFEKHLSSKQCFL